ncbi:MAG: hypothetical protein MAG795_00415 [Candidatus Woesearchaeota archaeon]|nr:hypothetical protein [Candidatus Woesearchaeota archaeon]
MKQDIYLLSVGNNHFRVYRGDCQEIHRAYDHWLGAHLNIQQITELDDLLAGIEAGTLEKKSDMGHLGVQLLIQNVEEGISPEGLGLYGLHSEQRVDLVFGSEQGIIETFGRTGEPDYTKIETLDDLKDFL